MKESLLERVVYRDLPESFGINSPDLLYRCVRVCAEKPGILLDYKNLGADLGHDQRTIAAYFSPDLPYEKGRNMGLHC